ncbi:MAG: protein kinase [Deltaproteobacteria bacterium]|nr:protein kinase [Deltaproteobacteria bacterium]
MATQTSGFEEPATTARHTMLCPRCGKGFKEHSRRCPEDGSKLCTAEVLARIGRRLKDYELQAVIGEGGMGAVYRAQHLLLQKEVAIKVLHPHFATRREAVDQFLREARAASRVKHTNIVDVTDFGISAEGAVFLVMEYLCGESLDDRMRHQGPLAVFDVVNNIGYQIARALAAAHDVGIVHRDLKPANVMLLTRSGRRKMLCMPDGVDGPQQAHREPDYDFVKVLDFGIAKFTDLGPSEQTRAGAIMGTPCYLSPEQAEARPVDARSDVYSLGVLCYEMLTGQVPFDGDSLLEVLNGHVASLPQPPIEINPSIDRRTNAVILRCLEKDPNKRYQTMDELCNAFTSCGQDRVLARNFDRVKAATDQRSRTSPTQRHSVQSREAPDEGTVDDEPTDVRALPEPPRPPAELMLRQTGPTPGVALQFLSSTDYDLEDDQGESDQQIDSDPTSAFAVGDSLPGMGPWLRRHRWLALAAVALILAGVAVVILPAKHRAIRSTGAAATVKPVAADNTPTARPPAVNTPPKAKAQPTAKARSSSVATAPAKKTPENAVAAQAGHVAQPISAATKPIEGSTRAPAKRPSNAPHRKRTRHKAAARPPKAPVAGPRKIGENQRPGSKRADHPELTIDPFAQ